MGQYYVDPTPRSLNPGIFSSRNNRFFDPESDTPQRARNEVLMEHYQNNQRIGAPTVIKAVVLRSTLSAVTETTTPETPESSEDDASAAARRIFEMMFPPTGKISLTCRIPGVDVAPAPEAIPIESSVWTQDEMEIETYGAIKTSTGGDDTHTTHSPTPEHKDVVYGEQDPMPSIGIIALHGTFISSDAQLLAQPLPLPGTVVEIQFDDLSDRTTGQYLGPVLAGFEAGAPPQSRGPASTPKPKVPKDSTPPGPDGAPSPPGNTPQPSGKVPTREKGPEARMDLVWGGYAADSGVVISGGKVRAFGFDKGKWGPATAKGKPRYPGAVSVQAWRNRAVHGGVGGKADKPTRKKRGDNGRNAKCGSSKFLKYVENGGSGKSDPLNSDRITPAGIKGLSGTFTFDRVRELVANTSLNPLEKYLVSLIAACEDQSDRPYSLGTGGYTGKTGTDYQKKWQHWTATECGMYVTNVRNIAYVLFDGAGANHGITGMTYEEYDKANYHATGPGSPVGGTAYPSSYLFLNIMAPDAPKITTSKEQWAQCVFPPGHRRARRQPGTQYGMTEGSLIPAMYAPTNKFTPWNSSVSAMPGDILLPRPKRKIEQWITGQADPGRIKNRVALLGHICIAFSGPNGVLRIAESGGAYRGSGSMPLEDYIIRCTKSSSIFFPSELFFFEPPEMTAIWKAMPGGRPTRKWTPELFQELCPNLVQIPEVQAWLS